MARKSVGAVISTGSGTENATGNGSYTRKIPSLVLQGLNCCIYSISEILQTCSYTKNNITSTESKIVNENGEFRKTTYTSRISSARNISLVSGSFIPGVGFAESDVGINYGEWILTASPKVTYFLKTAIATFELSSLFTLNTNIVNPSATFATSGSFNVTLSNSSGRSIVSSVAGYGNAIETTEDSSFSSYNYKDIGGQRGYYSGYSGYKTITCKFVAANPFNSLKNRQVIITRKEKINNKYQFRLYLGTIEDFQTTPPNNNWLPLPTDIEPSNNAIGTRLRAQNLPPEIGISSITVHIQQTLSTFTQRYESIDGLPNGTTTVSVRTIGCIEDLLSNNLALDNGRLLINENTESSIVAHLYIAHNPYSLGSFSQSKNVFEKYALRNNGTITLEKIESAPIYWATQQSAVISQVKYYP